jgi:hypothetical protein
VGTPKTAARSAASSRDTSRPPATLILSHSLTGKFKINLTREWRGKKSANYEKARNPLPARKNKILHYRE